MRPAAPARPIIPPTGQPIPQVRFTPPRTSRMRRLRLSNSRRLRLPPPQSGRRTSCRRCRKKSPPRKGGEAGGAAGANAAPRGRRGRRTGAGHRCETGTERRAAGCGRFVFGNRQCGRRHRLRPGRGRWLRRRRRLRLVRQRAGGPDTGSVRQQTPFHPIRRGHAVAESRARSSSASWSLLTDLRAPSRSPVPAAWTCWTRPRATPSRGGAFARQRAAAKPSREKRRSRSDSRFSIADRQDPGRDAAPDIGCHARAHWCLLWGRSALTVPMRQTGRRRGAHPVPTGSGRQWLP